MNLVDANVLLYAYNEADPHHTASRSWLEGAMAGGETVAHTWTALLADLLRATGTARNLTSDAHLGALALEHGATVITFDSDFGRFPGVRWRAPNEDG